jgi:TfoX/Sxy family transcriptional regulator of competence genes
VAYDEGLADRIRDALADRDDVAERKMFGGLAFMVSGNMCCGVIGSEAMLRLGPEGADEALDDPHARPMDFTGRPMKNMVYVEPAGLEDDADLRRWVARALAFATSLPPK